jgi:hypothetical protein
VAVRIRKVLRADYGKDIVVSSEGDDGLKLNDMSHYMRCKYDRVFDQQDDQASVFSYIHDSVTNVIKGFNCTIFAYGQTGSGKTYTMFGKNE